MGFSPSAALVLAAVLDLSGAPLDPLPRAGAGPAVLVFVRTDCPIANRYAPELKRLHDRFVPKGLSFWLVYADSSETPELIRQHQRAFGLDFRAVRDPDHELVRAVQASVTPEAAVFTSGSSGPRLVYRGRIDDRYVDFGRARKAPTRHDLREVLQALADGASPEPRTTPAIGCAISQ
jgi:AhpC/TSA family